MVLALARADANQLVTVLALDALAKLGADRGDHSCATRLLAEADALHPAVAHRLDEADRADRVAALASLQTP